MKRLIATAAGVVALAIPAASAAAPNGTSVYSVSYNGVDYTCIVVKSGTSSEASCYDSAGALAAHCIKFHGSWGCDLLPPDVDPASLTAAAG